MLLPTNRLSLTAAVVEMTVKWLSTTSGTFAPLHNHPGSPFIAIRYQRQNRSYRVAFVRHKHGIPQNSHSANKELARVIIVFGGQELMNCIARLGFRVVHATPASSLNDEARNRSE